MLSVYIVLWQDVRYIWPIQSGDFLIEKRTWPSKSNARHIIYEYEDQINKTIIEVEI